jgi:hypothetical protein
MAYAENTSVSDEKSRNEIEKTCTGMELASLCMAGIRLAPLLDLI